VAKTEEHVRLCTMDIIAVEIARTERFVGPPTPGAIAWRKT
jgi:hypothetical protein